MGTDANMNILARISVLLVLFVNQAVPENNIQDIMYAIMNKSSLQGCPVSGNLSDCSKRSMSFPLHTEIPEMEICRLVEDDKCVGCYHGQLYNSVCNRVYKSPLIECPSPPPVIYAEERMTSAMVNWTEPKLTNAYPPIDDKGIVLKQGLGNSGSMFPVGKHRVVYSATNTLGFTETCDIEFEVKAYKCTPPPWPENGKTSCESTSPVWGNVCQFQCSAGYSVVGTNSTTCLKTGQFDNMPPTCENASPPNITCFPPTAGTVITADPGSTNAVVTWQTPTAVDKFGNPIEGVRQIAGKYGSGESFPQGLYLIQFEIVDGNGQRDNCSFSFEVKVEYCNVPIIPIDGEVNCNYDDYRLGTQCTYKCNQGYSLKGNATRICQNTGLFDGILPACEATTCPEVVLNGAYFSCTNGRNLNSVCSVWCKPGYNLVGSATTTVCINGQWQNGIPQCQDVEAPIFDNCPSGDLTYLTSADADVSAIASWENITAQDNSGEMINVSLSTEKGSDSAFPIGSTTVSYIASDGVQQATCSFNVIVKHLRCIEPVFSDTTVRFNCDGYKRGDNCNISCVPGKELEGATVITCSQSDDVPFKPTWSMNGNPQPFCKDVVCPELTAPTAGTSSCTTTSDLKTCELTCDGELDYPRDSIPYTCDMNIGTWQPASRIANCIDKKLPPYVFILARLELMDGTCSGQEDQLKASFMSGLHDTGNWKDACQPGRNCTIEDLEVECIDPTLRRKRHGDPRVHSIYKRQTENAALSWKFRMNFDLEGNTQEDAQINHETYLIDLAIEMETDVYGGQFDNSLNGFTIDFFYYENIAEYSCDAGEDFQIDSNTCQSCPSGSKYDNVTDTCLPCPVGTYQDNIASTVCKTCPQGTTTIGNAANNQSQCVAPCGIHTFSFTGYEPCFNCPNGTFAIQTGSTNCTRPVTEQPTPPTKPCSNSPCGVHRCMNKPAGFACFCNEGFRGDTCLTVIDACTTHQCKNGATCINKPVTNSYTCECTSSYQGPYCEQEKAVIVSYWGEWSAWDTCTADLCGEGVERRARSCTLDSKQTPCKGNEEDSRFCNFEACRGCFPKDLVYAVGVKVDCVGDETSLNCSVNCEPGYETNITLPNFSCLNGNWTPGVSVSSCQKSADWSDWSSWTQCTSCGDTRTRNRSCNNPLPSPGGQPCSGPESETQPCTTDTSITCTDCKETDVILAPNAKINCTGDSTNMNCELVCDAGFICLEKPPLYTCSYGVWNPSKTLIPCTKALPPKSLSKIFTATYPGITCSNITLRNDAREQINQKAVSLDCAVKLRCQVSVVASCSGANNVGRRKRATDDTVINLGVSIAQSTGDLDLVNYVNKGQVSDSLQKLTESLQLMDNTTKEVSSDSSFFVVTVDGAQKSPISTVVTGVVECSPQSISQGGVCVECPPGTFHNGNQCVFCEQGYYQHVSGESTCNTCPGEGSTATIGSFAEGQCTAQSPSTADDNLIPIVVPVVLLVVITLAVIIIIYLWKKKKNRRSSSDEKTKLENGNTVHKKTSVLKKRTSSVAPLPPAEA